MGKETDSRLDKLEKKVEELSNKSLKVSNHLQTIFNGHGILKKVTRDIRQMEDKTHNTFFKVWFWAWTWKYIVSFVTVLASAIAIVKIFL